MRRSLITVDPEIHSGAPVFAGTRVPVKTLFDHLEAGDSLEIFLDDFPSVSRELAIAVLEQARAALAPDAHPAWRGPPSPAWNAAHRPRILDRASEWMDRRPERQTLGAGISKV